MASEEAGQTQYVIWTGGVLWLRSCEKMRSSSAVIETAIIMILPAGTFSACYFFGVLVSKLMVTDLDDLGETVLELWNGHVTRGWELWVGWQQRLRFGLGI